MSLFSFSFSSSFLLSFLFAITHKSCTPSRPSGCFKSPSMLILQQKYPHVSHSGNPLEQSLISNVIHPNLFALVELTFFAIFVRIFSCEGGTSLHCLINRCLLCDFKLQNTVQIKSVTDRILLEIETVPAKFTG